MNKLTAAQVENVQNQWTEKNSLNFLVLANKEEIQLACK